MTPTAIPGRDLSKSRVDRAGEQLRRWILSRDFNAMSHDQYLKQAAWDLFAWRDTFRVPLAKTVMGLRSFVKSEVPELQTPGAKLPVGQRLKREVCSPGSRTVGTSSMFTTTLRNHNLRGTGRSTSL